MNQKKHKFVRLCQSGNLEFYGIDQQADFGLPLFESGVSAGFPSPAEDYMEIRLDLNKELIQHPAATFYVRVRGNSMQDAGIYDNDILIVDRALEPKNKDIVISILDGDFVVKRIIKKGGKLFLQAENPEFKTIEIKEDNEFLIWGVVSYVIHKP